MKRTCLKPERQPRPRWATGGRQQDTLFRLSSAVVVAAALISFLVIVLVARSRPDGDSASSAAPQAESEVLGAGAEQAATPAGEPATFTLPTSEPGIVPDLVMQHGILAVATLRNVEMPYIVVEVENDEVPRGTVFQQAPAAGTALEEGVVVTLLVSR